MLIKKINYIAEFNLPSSSAYSIHVLKICDSFANLGFLVSLVIPYKIFSYNFLSIKKDYNLKNNFLIKSVFKKKNINFVYRFIFAINVLKICFHSNKNTLVISRSIISSILLSIFQKKNILELHHDLKGFTKFFFKLVNINLVRRNIKFILIHKNLLNFYSCINKKNCIILDDSVSLEDFIKYKKYNLKKKNHRICAYFGSLTAGKGLEIILSISEILKNIKFHIYTDLNLLDKKKICKRPNIKFFDHISYSMVPKVISKYDVVLMPYQKLVRVRSSNLETSRFMSPLKLFDYLASCKIIVASNLKVYSHILKDRYNSILLNPKDIQGWAEIITNIFDNYNKFSYLKKNAFTTAANYTWDNRVKNILKFNKNSNDY
jgi:glycosyltransferase involved in cell wall biosynthesis